MLQDSGAYPDIGAVLPFMTRTMATGVYAIKRGECSSNSVVTNTVPTVAYRGAGRPEATAAIERAIDCFAAEIGMDPAEVRRRNLIGAGDFPYTTPTGTEYDSGDYLRAFDLALEMSGYDDLRREQRRRREAGDKRQLGIGISTYVEITNGIPEGEYGAVEVRPDGRAIVRTGSSAHGQGHHTAWSMLVSDQLGIPMEDIDVIHGDTDIVPRGVGTFGSRSSRVAGPPFTWRPSRSSTRPRPSPPTSSRPPGTTSCSTSTAASSTSPAPRRWQRAGVRLRAPRSTRTGSR